MKDKKVLLWIYKNSKSQILRMAVLIFTSIVLAVNGVAIALFPVGLWKRPGRFKGQIACTWIYFSCIIFTAICIKYYMQVFAKGNAKQT